MPDRTMGSQTTVTLTEATVILGLSKRQIGRLVDDGVLRVQGPRTKDGFHVIKSDVTELAALRRKGQNNAVALQAMALARRLERDLTEIKTLLRMDGVTLGLEKEEVIGFCAYAEELFTRGSIRLEDIDPLLRKLLSVDEHYLGLVEKFAQEKEPWTNFIKLAQRLDETAVDDKTKALARTVRANLRNAAFVYAKSHHSNGRKYNFRFDDDRLAKRLLSVILNPGPEAPNQSPSAHRTGRTPSSD